MSARIWLGCSVLVAASFIGWFSSSAAAPLPPVPKAVPLDDRDELANKLMERVSIDKIEKVALKDVLASLSEKHQINLLIDPKGFPINEPVSSLMAVSLNQADDESVPNRQITIPAMKKVRLATVLKMIADQIDGGYLVEADHIKFVGWAKAYTIANPRMKNYTSHSAEDADPEIDSGRVLPNSEIFKNIPLVNAHFTERPLSEALREIGSRANWSVVLSPQTEEEGKTQVTARFANVPVDTAVATLAEMAGLKMSRKGNVLLVTTAERAEEFDPPHVSPQVKEGGGLGGGGLSNLPNNAAQTDPTVEELKKKLAAVEKAIEGMKKDKK